MPVDVTEETAMNLHGQDADQNSAKPNSAVEAPLPAGPMGRMEDADYAVVLLQALTTMALRSQRRQADLLAALRGAGLPQDPPQVRAALKLLLAQGAVDNLVPLSDGGLLLSVTQQGLARTVPSPQWLALDAPEWTGV